MTLPIEPPLKPMLARLEDEIPTGEGWRYEPKWDGFRAVVFREDEEVRIISRSGQPLARYFPELLEALRRALPARAVVDGEIILEGPRGLDFDALQQRLHPAASRVRRLAEETPASFVAFDLIALGDEDLRQRPLHERRRLLERKLRQGRQVFLTPQTADPRLAREWFVGLEAAGLDGIVAKQGDLRYAAGERRMVKVKHLRTADCVVGGYSKAARGGGVASLLLGLYDPAGALVYVGHTSSFSERQRRELQEVLRPLEGGSGFAADRSPGGPSRWTGGREKEWVALEPRRVCEVAFDYLQGDRFRHATRFLRWRPDKQPRECTYDQIQRPPGKAGLDALRPTEAAP